MDYPANFKSESAKLDQIISQVFLKTLHIILDSRIPSLRRDGLLLGSQVRKSDKWFNLVLGDRPAALDKLHFWHRNIMDPMIIDIILVHPKSASSTSTDQLTGLSDSEPSVETVIERWVVQYEPSMAMSPPVGENSSSYKKTYKKSIILLRSLYLQTRLLPAYRISRQLSSSACHSRNIDLVYKVSSFGDPLPGSEERMMKEYSFAPIQALNGCLSLSVTYCSALSDFKLEAYGSLEPKIITDYVGSLNTDAMRYLRASDMNFRTSSFSVTGRKPPCSSSSERPRSWTSGFHKPAHFVQSQSLGRIQPTCSGGLLASHDIELSPPVSLSASPSTPSYMSGGNHMQTHVSSATAPVTIPSSAACRSSRYLSSNLSDPTKSPLPPLSPKSTKHHQSSSQDSTSRIRSYRSTEGSKFGDSPSGLSNRSSSQKVVRDDSGRFPAMLSSSGSPGFTYSRSSTMDDLEDCDFSCPFDFDDDPAEFRDSRNLDWRNTWDPASHSSPAGQKSQDAAVGVLVHMLRTAPPLRQDQSCYSSPPLNAVNDGTESTLSMSRRTSDALEELRSYMVMRDLLVSKSATPVLDKEEM